MLLLGATIHIHQMQGVPDVWKGEIQSSSTADITSIPTSLIPSNNDAYGIVFFLYVTSPL